jgi:[acyl-carrier-protein] S-malonyltransferase
MKYVLVFPGQNSRYPEMLDSLRVLTPVANGVLCEASDVLGRNLSEHYRKDNPDIFARNRDIQVGVFLANFIYARTLEADGIRPDASAGLSLGEYNHLVEIGALTFASALQLLDARGAAYESAPAGRMISVFPCQKDQVEEALEIGRKIGNVDISIHLGRKHFVLGGETDAVEASATWLEEEVFAQSNVIDSRLPMHAGVFKPAADAFKAALESSHWQRAHSPYLPNVEGKFVENQSPSDFTDKLYRHVFSTVQWQRSVELMTQSFPDATFIEVGPKAVLYNQLSREYRSLITLHTDKESCWQTSRA